MAPLWQALTAARESFLYGPIPPAGRGQKTVASYAAGAGGSAVSGTAYNLVPVGVQGRPQYPATDPETLLKIYIRNELIHACVNRRAASAIGPHLRVQARASGSAWRETPGHPLRRLWMRPNPGMDEAAFLKAVLMSVDLTGRFYGEIVRSPAGAPAAIYPLSPAKVAVVPGGDNTVDHYEFRDGNRKAEIAPENMLTFAEYDPANPAWGAVSRLAACLGTVDADNAQTDYVRAYFNNAGVPSGILKVKGVYSQEQSDSLRARWREKFGRLWGRQHDVAVLDDNADYQQIGAHLDQIENELLRSVSESRICMTFGVPPLIIYAYVGLLRATYSNLAEAWRGFWDATLSPLYAELRAWLQWRLLTEYVDPELIYAERVRLAWDFSEVPAKQEDVSVAHGRAADAWKAGGLTLNEYRAAIGQPPDPAGAYYLRTLAQVEVPAGAVEDPTGAVIGKGLWVPRAYKGRAVARDCTAIEQQVAKTAAAYLQEQYDRAARAVR